VTETKRNTGAPDWLC